MTYSQAILGGDRLALARLLTQVENDAPESRTALIELFPHTGKAHLIGVTGAPGTGKSSLVNQLALYYRKTKEKRVAIIAVDPSSPFTGGAVLGDRVRMRDLSGDTGVFIRSMATRGSLGGLAQSTATWRRSLTRLVLISLLLKPLAQVKAKWMWRVSRIQRSLLKRLALAMIFKPSKPAF